MASKAAIVTIPEPRSCMAMPASPIMGFRQSTGTKLMAAFISRPAFGIGKARMPLRIVARGRHEREAMFVTSSTRVLRRHRMRQRFPSGARSCDREGSPAEADRRRRVAKSADEKLADKNPTDDRNGGPLSGTISIRTDDNVPISGSLPFASRRIDLPSEEDLRRLPRSGAPGDPVRHRRCRKAAIASEIIRVVLR